MPSDDHDPGMDELTAHLDRGWERLNAEDLRASERSARAALVAEPESPEAYLLLGQIDLARGHAERAMDRFHKAMELDPDYAEPYLCAAETALFELDDPEQALELAEEVVERAEDESEYLDGLLLKIEALLGIEDEDAEDRARETLAELPPEPLPEPMFALRAGRAALDLELFEDAERHYRRAVELEPDNPEAYHGLGMCAEARDDREAMVAAWLKTRELDLAAAPPPWHITEREFQEVAAESLGSLPDHIRERLANVPILAHDYPDASLVQDGFDPRILGFFAGVPYPEKGNISGTPPHLDCILLFQRNIERAARSREETLEEINITLLHETGHFFALSEDELEAMGLG
jgi:predicted Zn-dependent protease with MMP-like domain